VTFQYNESYGNHTRTATDVGGFNFDWDTTNSLMQYNYAHDNDGPAFLPGAGSHVNSGNVIRYNISENDGRRNGRAAIHLWRHATGDEKRARVGTRYQGNPKRTGVGSGGTVGNAGLLSARAGYKLVSTSPRINRAISPPIQLTAAVVDFVGNSTTKGGKYDIG